MRSYPGCSLSPYWPGHKDAENRASANLYRAKLAERRLQQALEQLTHLKTTLKSETHEEKTL